MNFYLQVIVAILDFVFTIAVGPTCSLFTNSTLTYKHKVIVPMLKLATFLIISHSIVSVHSEDKKLK